MANLEFIDHDGELNESAVEKLTLDITKALHLVGHSPDENTQLLYRELMNECEKYLREVETSKEHTKNWVKKKRLQSLFNLILTEVILTISIVPPLVFILYIEDPSIKITSGFILILLLGIMLDQTRNGLISLRVNSTFVDDYAEDLAYWDEPETILDLAALLLPEWKIDGSNIDNKVLVNRIVDNAIPVLQNELSIEEDDELENEEKKINFSGDTEEKIAELENEHRRKQLLLKTLGPKATKAYLDRKSE